MILEGCEGKEIVDEIRHWTDSCGFVFGGTFIGK